MRPVRAVPALDEVEDGHAGLALGREAAPVQQLALEGGEETFTGGVVVDGSNCSASELSGL